MADTHVILTGNLTDDPDLRYTPNGTEVANFRLAVTARVKDGDTWRDGETSSSASTCGGAGRARRRVPHQGRPGGGHRPRQVAVLGDPEGDKRSVVQVEAKLLVGGAGQPDTSLCEACEYRRYLAATGGRDLANEERAAGASCPSRPELR